MDDQGADTFFVGDHPEGGPKDGKPSQDTVILLIKHIKNADCAGDPEHHIFQGNKEKAVPDQTAQYQESVIHKGNDNACEKGMQEKVYFVNNVLAHKRLLKKPGKQGFPLAVRPGLF